MNPGGGQTEDEPTNVRLPDAARVDSARVLLVDDDRNLLDLTATYLQRESDVLEPVTAGSGREAVDLLDGVDCVVSDYEMPGMGGLELLEAIRDVDPHVPFVLFTGRGSEEIASDAISAGVDDYLQKGGGDQYTILANRVETLVEKHRTERVLRRRLLAVEAVERVESGRATAATVAVDATGGGAVVVENDGTVLGADAGFAALVGREESSLPGENVASLSPGLGVAMDETGTCPRRLELELETPEKGRATYDCRIAPSSTDEGSVAAVLYPV